MVYKQYICKKRFKGQAICGQVNIPYGTILENFDNFLVTDNHDIICAITSQNCTDYFWGYDENNPDEEIRRQELAAKLNSIAPADTTEHLLDDGNIWRKYGHLEEFYTGYIWVWDDFVSDLPIERLEYLLSCIDKKECPIW